MDLKKVVGWLLCLGALVWLIDGVTGGTNIVESIVGAGMIARLIYVIVGLAGLYKLGMLLGMVGKK